MAKGNFGLQAFISVEYPQIQPRKEATFYSHGIILKFSAYINMAMSPMHIIMLLKTCFLRDVHVKNAYVYYLKKIKTVINSAKTKDDFLSLSHHIKNALKF